MPFLFERRFCPTSGMFHDFAMFCSDFSVWKNSRRAFRIGDISRPKATCFSGLGCIVLSQHMFFWHHRHCLVKEIRLPRKWHRFVPIWEKAYTFDSRKISSRYTGEIPLQYVFFLHQVTTSQLECIPKVLSPNASQRKDWKSLENTGPFCANDWIIHTHGPLGFFGGNC